MMMIDDAVEAMRESDPGWDRGEILSMYIGSAIGRCSNPYFFLKELQEKGGFTDKQMSEFISDYDEFCNWRPPEEEDDELRV
jgi:hypothetical protein